ncbi:hypothetical protein QBC39DRAFT_112893 [Podospora conica]|nr:hypothetical protein QBC39DRAFT_112893 [Schizothecium conicum]
MKKRHPGVVMAQGCLISSPDDMDSTSRWIGPATRRSRVRAVDGHGDGVHDVAVLNQAPRMYLRSCIDKATLVSTTLSCAPASSPRTIRGDRSTRRVRTREYWLSRGRAAMDSVFAHQKTALGMGGNRPHETKSGRPATSPCCRRGLRICHAGFEAGRIHPSCEAVSSLSAQRLYGLLDWILDTIHSSTYAWHTPGPFAITKHRDDVGFHGGPQVGTTAELLAFSLVKIKPCRRDKNSSPNPPRRIVRAVCNRKHMGSQGVRVSKGSIRLSRCFRRRGGAPSLSLTPQCDFWRRMAAGRRFARHHSATLPENARRGVPRRVSATGSRRAVQCAFCGSGPALERSLQPGDPPRPQAAPSSGSSRINSQLLALPPWRCLETYMANELGAVPLGHT